MKGGFAEKAPPRFGYFQCKKGVQLSYAFPSQFLLSRSTDWCLDEVLWTVDEHTDKWLQKAVLLFQEAWSCYTIPYCSVGNRVYRSFKTKHNSIRETLVHYFNC